MSLAKRRSRPPRPGPEAAPWWQITPKADAQTWPLTASASARVRARAAGYALARWRKTVEQGVRIEQDAQRFAAAKRGFQIRRHRAAACASLPAPKPNLSPAPPNR